MCVSYCDKMYEKIKLKGRKVYFSSCSVDAIFSGHVARLRKLTGHGQDEIAHFSHVQEANVGSGLWVQILIASSRYFLSDFLTLIGPHGLRVSSPLTSTTGCNSGSLVATSKP